MTNLKIGDVVKVAGTHSSNGRGNAVGVVKVLEGSLAYVEAGVRGTGLTLLAVNVRDLRVAA